MNQWRYGLLGLGFMLLGGCTVTETSYTPGYAATYYNVGYAYPSYAWGTRAYYPWTSNYYRPGVYYNRGYYRGYRTGYYGNRAYYGGHRWGGGWGGRGWRR